MEAIHNFDSEESGTVSYNSKNRGNLDFDEIFDKKPSKIMNGFHELIMKLQ